MMTLRRHDQHLSASDYTWMTLREVLNTATSWGAQIRKVKPVNGEFVGPQKL